METLCVNTPIGVLTVEVTGNSFSTAGGISVYLQDSDANLYPLVATEFNSGNNALETTVFQDQEHIEEPVEIRHSGLPETDNPYENKVVKPVTMLEYLKQMHPTFQKSIENNFQHRAEKLITELIASVEKEPIVNAETYTTPAAGSIGTAKVGEKVICYDEYLHDYVEHTMLVRTIEKDPEMKTETNPEGVVLYGIDLSDENDESMICTVSEGNYVCSAGVATVDELMKVERNEAYDRFAKEMKGLLPCFVSRDCSEIEYEVDFALYGLREKIDTIVENLKTENFSDNGKPDGTSGIYQLVRPSIETIIDYCNDLAADEKLEVFEFGEDCDLVLHIYKDEEYDASKDKDSYNIVSISTARNGEWVDDTDDVYVTDGSLANELDRIYHYRKFATK